MSATTLRQMIDRAISEKRYQAEIVKLAQLHGWLTFHAFDSRRSPEGFPDLVLAHPEGRILFLEVKAERGKTTPAQDRWMDVLQTSVDAAVVRPSDWSDVVEWLTRGC